MPLFSSRPQSNSVDGILQIINMGQCDDHTIDQLRDLVAEMSGDDVKSLADSLMANLVKYPDDVAVLTGTVMALEVLPFMPKAKNDFIITLLVSLFKAPVSKKDALQRSALKAEVTRFLLFFVNEDDEYAKLMMPELISALDDTHAGISSSVFHTLQRLAVDKPEYFERYSAALIKQLGSINKSTRAESAKLIGLIAKSHPEYVSRAMPFLQSLASFYPDAHVKRNANEAYQIIWGSMKKDQPVAAARKTVSHDGKSFADIVKLNSNTPNGHSAEAQFTDAELREIIDLTRKEFKSDAEAILDSLGVGHLNVKGKESRPKPKPPAPKPEPVEPPKAKKPVPPPAKPPVVAKPEPVKPAHPSHQAPHVGQQNVGHQNVGHQNVGQQNVGQHNVGIITAMRRDAKEPPARPQQPKLQMPKCPKCGAVTWAEGQLCDNCAGAEFDRRAARGQFDSER